MKKEETAMKNSVLLVSLVVLLCLPLRAFAAESPPDCSGPDRWAAAMVGATLKNLGLSPQADGYEKIEIERLASEPLPSKGLGRTIFRQVHKMSIHDRGNVFTVITVNNASHLECSESEVRMYFTSIMCNDGGPGCRDVGGALKK